MLTTVALVAAASLAQAETYRCTSVTGTYTSSRPCPIQGGTKLGVIGPAPETPPRHTASRHPSLPRPVGRAPEHLTYMSAECASLSDGVRTAPTRGLHPSTIAELRDDYQRRCSSDESQARRRWAQDQQRERSGREQKQAQLQADTQREAAQQQRTFAQCGEMRRIILNKNERLATMTPGEVADLRRFEANFAERCQSRPQ